MKKVICLLVLLLLCSTAQTEMYWLGLNPNCQEGNAGDSGQVTDAGRSHGRSSGSYAGFEIELKIVDSAAGTISDDSSHGTYYTHPINTENVISATGLIQLISITDTSTTTGHLFDLGGDSTFVRYTVKTGYVPYDGDALVLVYDDVSLNAVTGTATRDALTFSFEGDEGTDSLFKPVTWIEFTLWDSTLWGEKVSGPFDSGSTTLSDATIAGTYTGGGELGRFHLIVEDENAGSSDSVIWYHYGNQGHVTSVDTAAMAGSAQNLDSGMTVDFNATTGHADGDVFIFHVSDSLHYGKTVKYKLRAGLNVHYR